VPLRFIVVDNASEPESLARLQALLGDAPDVELIEHPTNGGFGGGANVGLRHWLDTTSPGEVSDWALLSPHDVEPAADCLALLFAAVASEPMAGLACADVGDGQTPYIDPYFGGLTMAGDDTPGWQPADYPHGTLMALNRRCLDEVGLFDEAFFAYCEEADLALRARAAGWTCGLVRGARVQNVHLGSSVALVDYLQQRNTLRLVRSMSGRYKVFIRLMISLYQLASGVARPATAPLMFHPRARLLGIRDFLRGRYGPPPADLNR